MVRLVSCSLVLSVSLVAFGCGSSDTGAGGSGTGTTTATGATGATGQTGATGATGTGTGNTSSTSTGGTGGAFGCSGQPLPTTAPAMVKLAGVTQTAGLMGTKPVASALVEVFQGTNTTPVTSTMSDAQGNYSVMVSTGGVPVDGYARGTAPTYMTTYLYPAGPIAADITNGTVLLVTPGTFNLLETFASATQMQGNGWIGVVVSDCDGNPLAGATVTTNPAGTVRYNGGGIPSNTAMMTDADGVAYVFNVPAGDVTVQGTVQGHTLREHGVLARADVLTTTVLQP